MKKFTALLVVAAASMYFTGCGENGTNVTNGFADQKGSSSSTEKKGNADEEETGDYDETVEFLDELPNCTARKDGKVYFVEEDEVAYTCKYDEDLKEGEWVKKEKKTSKPEADETVEFFDDLPNCTAKKDGKIYFVEDDEVAYTCKYDEDEEEGDWVSVKTEDNDKPSSSNSSILPDKPSSSNSSTPTSAASIPGAVVTLADLPTCTKSIEGAIIEVESEGDYYYCANLEWHSLNAEIEDPPTSSASSSTKDYVCGDMWCGPEGQEQVITGLDAGANLSGWWWEYNDQGNGGGSYFSWPTSKGNEFSDESFEPIIEECDGLCGIVHLDNGILTYNFAGIGFNVSGEDSDEIANASSWGGICVVYSSEAPITVEMGLEDETYYGSDLPKYTLIAGNNKIVDIDWSAFRQAGWLDEDGDPYPSITGTTAARVLHSLKFKFTGGEGTYSFNIQSIGTYGSCKQNPQ